MTTPSQPSSTNCKADLAAFIAAGLNQAGRVDPSQPVDAALIESLIAGFERERAGGAGQHRLCLVSVADELAQKSAEQELGAVAATLREALPPAVVAAAGAHADNAGVLVSLVVEEGREMRDQVQANSLVVAMHKDLVGMLVEILPKLEQANADKAVLASARTLLDRALAIQEGRGIIPATVSPIRILAAIENVSSSHQEILMRYGNVLDKQALVRGIRVVGEAAKLLEDIHGPAGEEDGEDEEQHDGQRP